MSEKRGLPAATVQAPADKRFRRAETRPGRRSGGWWRSPWLRWGVLVGLAVVAIGVGVTTLAQADVFVVRSVTVRGNARLSTGEVLTIIDGLKGESLFKADLGAYRARLLDSPWVADAAFRRVLPSTIELSLTERAPMAIGRLGDQLFLVDAGGVIIDEYGPQYAQYDLPIVDGLVTAPSAGAPAVDPARARAAARVIESLAAAPAIKARVAQFDVANAHDVVALVDQDPVWLHLGDRDFAARVRRYLELAPTLKGEHDDIDYVDLRFEERIYMRNRSTAKKD